MAVVGQRAIVLWLLARGGQACRNGRLWCGLVLLVSLLVHVGEWSCHCEHELRIQVSQSE